MSFSLSVEQVVVSHINPSRKVRELLLFGSNLSRQLQQAWKLRIPTNYFPKTAPSSTQKRIK
jgi:hypothetical protein